MQTKKVKCSIQVLEGGEFTVKKTDGTEAKIMSHDEYIEELAFFPNRKTHKPVIEVIEANPTWVIINGIPYYIR